MSHITNEDAPIPPPPKELRCRTNVHGTVFAARADVLNRLQLGDRLLVIPDPPVENEAPAVWLHVSGGDVLGYLPVQISAWLGPWMLSGGRCQATVVNINGAEVASWNRIEVELERSAP
jgi:hypothetical protein